MVVSSNAHRPPQGWYVLPGRRAVGAPDDTATDRDMGVSRTGTHGTAPLASTLPSVWMEAVVTTLILCTPLHPLGYVTALVAFHRTRTIARANGWPFVPGVALLACACAVAAGHDLFTMWMQIHAG